jgi:hypothetical protein
MRSEKKTGGNPKKAPKATTGNSSEKVPEMTAADLMVETPDFKLMRLLSLCREYGVLRFEGSIPGTGNLVKFDLAPVLAKDPAPVAPSLPVEPAQPRAAVKEGTKKVGADGLTAEQQEALYERPMDAKT